MTKALRPAGNRGFTLVELMVFSHRPYRQGWVKENVLDFMRENRGIMFDPQVVDAFFSLEI